MLRSEGDQSRWFIKFTYESILKNHNLLTNVSLRVPGKMYLVLRAQVMVFSGSKAMPANYLAMPLNTQHFSIVFLVGCRENQTRYLVSRFYFSGLAITVRRLAENCTSTLISLISFVSKVHVVIHCAFNMLIMVVYYMRKNRNALMFPVLISTPILLLFFYLYEIWSGNVSVVFTAQRISQCPQRWQLL